MPFYQKHLTVEDLNVLDVQSWNELEIEGFQDTVDIFNLNGTTIKNGGVVLSKDNGYVSFNRGINRPTIDTIKSKYDNRFFEKSYYEGDKQY